MSDIVTVTLNPAVDVATSVERIVDTHKLRCAPPRRDPGGGGINVARTIHRLGGDCIAIYVSGGATGRALAQLLEAERLPTGRIPIAGETRENICVTETATGREYRFLMPGPAVTAAEWHACATRIETMRPAPRYLVLSGSLPPGVPANAYATLARVASRNGTRVVVDAAGAALSAALDVGVHLVKPSLGELSALAGEPLDEASACRKARELVSAGRADIVAVTLGAAGAWVVSRDCTVRLPGRAAAVCSTVGAGDSFVGAMVWALARELPFDDACRYALAASAASVEFPGTALCTRDAVERIYAELAAGAA
ncbi:1-phosphofructokinase family hexose kinase [Burkholderia multivorans]|uniref:1-phosphofructokinase family hexose kinase n=1 Tax=Burkholderia multivorans TaxID=87883 RepID=UPI0015895B05|nr:1-phosphofructokinase family hexose kinase [Burkholderia multivorans]MDN8089692.1 1-phosphofructokinase family hexose kinase [Burkholderia multivorans]MDN8095213.1 1-phosphofructokinase family hexose kinase [Burkholderia multivorans]MDN8105065.1 1-phosphofructokinase family hexose kinase [Burkholderia multivorans]MDN8125922.1 1-phosphofructokinase family hexose kinase [Burkholderia multivorans]MDN8130250.1 1-phosphofructokinase family hexose kinase [Burkholderia multivorans]